MSSEYRQGAAIVAERADGHFLLVKKPRTRHAWQFPQGGIEPGETAKEAALREFHEEVGTDKIEIVGEEQGTFQYDFPPGAEFPAYLSDQEKKDYKGQCIHLFRGKFLGTDDDISLAPAELADYRWVTVDDLPELLEDPTYLRIVTTICNHAG